MLAAPGLLAAAIALQACNSSMTDAGTPAGPSFTLTAARDTVRLAPGASATTSITATRAGGLTSPIIYATFAASAGLSASIAAADAGDSATLIITVTGFTVTLKGALLLAACPAASGGLVAPRPLA